MAEANKLRPYLDKLPTEEALTAATARIAPQLLLGRDFLREQVWGFVRDLLRQPERIEAGLDRLIEEERADAQRDPEREAEFWARKIAETEIERRGYQRLAAALEELDETRETAERELESYASMAREALETLAPEERHRVYKLLRLGVRFRPDWPLEITRVFAEVAEEAEIDLSSCKQSPLSV